VAEKISHSPTTPTFARLSQLVFRTSKFLTNVEILEPLHSDLLTSQVRWASHQLNPALQHAGNGELTLRERTWTYGSSAVRRSRPCSLLRRHRPTRPECIGRRSDHSGTATSTNNSQCTSCRSATKRRSRDKRSGIGRAQETGDTGVNSRRCPSRTDSQLKQHHHQHQHHHHHHHHRRRRRRRRQHHHIVTFSNRCHRPGYTPYQTIPARINWQPRPEYRVRVIVSSNRNGKKHVN